MYTIRSSSPVKKIAYDIYYVEVHHITATAQQQVLVI